MAPEISQQQNKPSRKGFFVLIAIIAVVIFAAYALTRKSGTVPIEMTESEREALASQFKDVPQQEMTKQERDSLVKAYSATKATPYTDVERKQLAEQFNN
jgi:glucose dehydrogenase